MKIFELLIRRADQWQTEAMAYWTDYHAALVKERIGAMPDGAAQRQQRRAGRSARAVCAAVRRSSVGLAADRTGSLCAQIATPSNPIVAD